MAAADRIDRIVEKEPNGARYYAGLIAWQPGELHEELRKGPWLALEAPLDTVFRRDVRNLWLELLEASLKPSA